MRRYTLLFTLILTWTLFNLRIQNAVMNPANVEAYYSIEAYREDLTESSGYLHGLHPGVQYPIGLTSTLDTVIAS